MVESESKELNNERREGGHDPRYREPVNGHLATRGHSSDKKQSVKKVGKSFFVYFSVSEIEREVKLWRVEELVLVK